MKVECPRCRKQIEWTGSPFRPFCSRECKEQDLGKWANEEYRIAAEEEAGEQVSVKPSVDDEDDA